LKFVINTSANVSDLQKKQQKQNQRTTTLFHVSMLDSAKASASERNSQLAFYHCCPNSKVSDC
jgi:hypothetical protein